MLFFGPKGPHCGGGGRVKNPYHLFCVERVENSSTEEGVGFRPDTMLEPSVLPSQLREGVATMAGTSSCSGQTGKKGEIVTGRGKSDRVGGEPSSKK